MTFKKNKIGYKDYIVRTFNTLKINVFNYDKYHSI